MDDSTLRPFRETRQRRRVLFFSTDLPYFPGKNGHDFFNLRHLAKHREVAVVGPRYDFQPAAGIENLRQSVTELHTWPDEAKPAALIIAADAGDLAFDGLDRIPEKWRQALLKRLLRIQSDPSDALEKLAIFSNCAPQLFSALQHGVVQAIVLVQSNLAPCLNYLPGPGARVMYFHDIRSDYFRRMRSVGTADVADNELTAVTAQEDAVCDTADIIGFVSSLDESRAFRLFSPTVPSVVAPIPVDTEYFTPAGNEDPHEHPFTILFTGHLTHPPNIDAVQYFVTEIWPLVRRQVPNAVFIAAGMLPAKELTQLADATDGFELRANVPDIRPSFHQADVYVVPMRFGGGVRQKIFEAWSMRVPVVCTTMAAEGTRATHGASCWLEDSATSFAQRIVTLARDPSEAKPLVDNAKTLVETNNSIDAAAGQFCRLVEQGVHHRRAKPFKLLYDLRWMEIGRSGGAEQMAHELITGVSQIDHRNEYRVQCPRATYHEWSFPPGFRIQPHYSDEIETVTERVWAATTNRLAHSLGLPPLLTPAMRSLRTLRRMDFDLVHSLVGYIHPDLEGFPHILTALDLQHIEHPEFFGESELAERDRLYRESCRRAQHIICISDYTRQDLHRHYGVPLDKMSVVWITPSRQVWRVLSLSQRNRLLAKLGVTGPFLFFPGHCWPHKNHQRLVEAFDQIIDSIPSDMNLVLTGRALPSDHPAALTIRERNLEKRVLHLGYRSPLEIQALFQSCHLLVFPSLFEGFGMPVAEAMIAGKPVACSNRSSLPEIAGDAALTFDPTDTQAIASSILEIVHSPERYAHLAAAARRRRSLFSARLGAVKTLAVYQRAYEELYS